MTNRQFCCPPDDDEAYRRLIDNANQPLELVPIRLDMELDNIKLRDTFVYNKVRNFEVVVYILERKYEDKHGFA